MGAYRKPREYSLIANAAPAGACGKLPRSTRISYTSPWRGKKIWLSAAEILLHRAGKLTSGFRTAILPFVSVFFHSVWIVREGLGGGSAARVLISPYQYSNGASILTRTVASQ